MKLKKHFATIIFPFLIVLLFISCEKKEGKMYLRVINSLNTASEISVKDSKSDIPVDGNYYEVSGYLETEYKLLDLKYDSLASRYPGELADTVFTKDIILNRYFGDFEKLPGESYYTLNLRYNVVLEKSPYTYDLIKYWYLWVYTYTDLSTLSYSPIK